MGSRGPARCRAPLPVRWRELSFDSPTTSRILRSQGYVRLLRPLPRAVTRPISLIVLVAWAATIGVLLKRTYLEASSINLATDLATLRHQCTVARHLLQRREDRLLGQSGRRQRRRVRAAGRRTTADDAARGGCACAYPHSRTRGPHLRPAVVRLPSRSGNRAHDRERRGRGPSPHAQRDDRWWHDERRARAERAPSAVDQSGPPSGRRRSRRRRASSMGTLRSGDARATSP